MENPACVDPTRVKTAGLPPDVTALMTFLVSTTESLVVTAVTALMAFLIGTCPALSPLPPYLSRSLVNALSPTHNPPW